MADYGRVASELVEAAADENDAGRVSTQLVEAAGSENLAGRAASLISMVAAADTAQARVATLFCEVFMVPRSLDLYRNPLEGADVGTDPLGSTSVLK